MRLSTRQRQANETRIRAVMDRLLAGHLPAGANCDVSTLARLSGIDRAAFYGTRPYSPLREEFDQRLQSIRDTGQTPNPHHAQLATLKATIAGITDRLARRDRTIADLTDFKNHALSQLAAQHEEITRLRAAVASAGNLRVLRPRANTDQPTRPASEAPRV
jgi:hypothetical protein